MEKIGLNKVLYQAKLIKKCDYSFIYLLPNDEILKIFDIKYLNILELMGINIEKKILESEKLNISDKVIRPIKAVYSLKGDFIGYTMPLARGISFNEYEEMLTMEDREDLYRYAKLHYNLEKIVKDSEDVVFTDLCTCDNIYVNNNYDIQIIDYDGHQVKNIPTPIISTNLGDSLQYRSISKYYKNGLFTKQLDIKSLIILYFLDVFNIDLNKVGAINPVTNTPVTLDEVFYMLNLFDNDFNHKVWKIFKDNTVNEYLSEDMFRIADRYDMYAKEHPFQKGAYLKCLRKK